MISANSQRIARRVQLHFRDKEKDDAWVTCPRSQVYCGVELRSVSRWSKVAPCSLWLHHAASQFYKFSISEGFYLLICFVSFFSHYHRIWGHGNSCYTDAPCLPVLWDGWPCKWWLIILLAQFCASNISAIWSCFPIGKSD